jgi:hypothetical protein
MDNYNVSQQTEDWQKYTKGRTYNHQCVPDYYTTVDTNIAFASGNQWRNVVADGLPKPVFNIIKRAVTFFVAIITTNAVATNCEPLTYAEDDAGNVVDPQMQDDKHTSDIATSEIGNLFHKFGMDNRIRDALFDAAIMGDVAAHMRFDPELKPYNGAFQDIKGEIEFELVDGTNVMLGNANNPKIDTKTQPYIILSGRDTVDNLRDQAKYYKQKQSDIDSITTDKMVDGQAGDAGKIEIIGDNYGKALYIIIYKFDKKTKTIKVSKCLENVYIYKDIDTGLNNYPVAWLCWEKQKNQYHGRAVATGMIPNQIFINRMFAMVMYNLMMTAFPKAVYDSDRISGWSNEIGTAIGLSGMNPGENISNAATYLQPGNMSNQIVQVIELAISQTKESLGINDALTGSMHALNYRAVVAMQTAAQAPLGNVKANLYEWVSDISRILLDMMGTYYGKRPIVIDDGKGSKTKEDFDFSVLKNIWLNVKCDVGAANYWSEVSQVETLDNLLKQGSIDILDYLDALPDGYITDKQELIDGIKARLDAQQQAQATKANPPIVPTQPQGGPQQPPQQDNTALYEKLAQFMNTLPPDVQAKLKSMPDAQMEQILMQLMQQAQGGQQSA